MKKSFIESIIIASALTALISCGSTSSQAKPETESKSGTTRSLKVINSEAETPKTDPAVTLYTSKTTGIKLSSVSSPAVTSAQKAFSSPFVFKAVKADGTPAEGLELAVTYPETKSNGNVNFGLTNLTTDAEGLVSFTSPVPSDAFNSIITVYPAGDVTNAEIAKLASEKSVTVPYKVKSNKLTAGGTISIVDFTAAGKPIVNNSVSSSKLLMAMMKLGFKRIGNADFTTAILQDDPAVVYKSAKSLLGNNSAFLIYGTVKYAGETTQTEDGKYSLTLNAKITCINMKDGSILYTTERSHTQVEDKEWNCLPNARAAIQEAIAPELLYQI